MAVADKILRLLLWSGLFLLGGIAELYLGLSVVGCLLPPIEDWQVEECKMLIPNFIAFIALGFLIWVFTSHAIYRILIAGRVSPSEME